MNEINKLKEKIIKKTNNPIQEDLYWYDKIGQMDSLTDLLLWKSNNNIIIDNRKYMKKWSDISKWLIWLKRTNCNIINNNEINKLKENCFNSQKLLDDNELYFDLITCNYDIYERNKCKNEFSRIKLSEYSSTVYEYNDIIKDERNSTANNLIKWSNEYNDFDYGKNILSTLNSILLI